jgi:IS1 family transposase
VGKETGKTSYIERFNNTLLPQVGRLVRKTLSFSKKLSHILARFGTLCIITMPPFALDHYYSPLPTFA